ncbi:hypothetical protein NHX12_013933 [Muraenolepis orangiensis]|uniref:Uncharacterized protein n=1 Tax=Muraenolepis orangiensis TaxID=630683 RepID=A0A9Q0DEJ4_9TELE|nr:hypothetical protein NHX12_013933 [Muraenolepis orangiensis]
MESEAPPQKRPSPRTAVLNLFSSLCSVASIAFCVFLSLNASGIRTRLEALESGVDTSPLLRPPGGSADHLDALIQGRVDQLLSQRSYEHFAKIRTARQAEPTECTCPPGKQQQTHRQPHPSVSSALCTVVRGHIDTEGRSTHGTTNLVSQPFRGSHPGGGLHVNHALITQNLHPTRGNGGV